MNEELKKLLKETFGLNDAQVEAIEKLGVKEVTDMEMLTVEDLMGIEGVVVVTARKIVKHFVPTVQPAMAPDAATSTAVPSEKEKDDFLKQTGMSSDVLSMIMLGNLSQGSGVQMDMTSIVPIPRILEGYNPKMVNIWWNVLGQVEAALGGTPIIVINEDGSINREETVAYITSLQTGFDAPEDDIFYGSDGIGRQLIKVGVDAQSVYDMDPLRPGVALPLAGMGFARVRWNDVGTDVRQLVYLATEVTHELDPDDPAQQQWLRDNIKPGVKRLNLAYQFPKANMQWNSANAMGTLPNLKVRLTRTGRKPELRPRARTKILPSQRGDASGAGAGFRDEQ